MGKKQYKENSQRVYKLEEIKTVSVPFVMDLDVVMQPEIQD